MHGNAPAHPIRESFSLSYAKLNKSQVGVSRLTDSVKATLNLAKYFGEKSIELGG